MPNHCRKKYKTNHCFRNQASVSLTEVHSDNSVQKSRKMLATIWWMEKDCECYSSPLFSGHPVGWISVHSFLFILHLKTCTKDFPRASGSLESKMNTILPCLLVCKDGWQENSCNTQLLYHLKEVYRERNMVYSAWRYQLVIRDKTAWNLNVVD